MATNNSRETVPCDHLSSPYVKGAPSNPDSTVVAPVAVPPANAKADFKEAFREFKSLSRAERRDRIRAVRARSKLSRQRRKRVNAFHQHVTVGNPRHTATATCGLPA